MSFKFHILSRTVNSAAGRDTKLDTPTLALRCSTHLTMHWGVVCGLVATLKTTVARMTKVEPNQKKRGRKEKKRKEGKKEKEKKIVETW